MPYGISSLSIVPVRNAADDTAEMVTQLLYGDHFKILDTRKHWSRIRVAFDKTEGWIGNRQFAELSESDFKSLEKADHSQFAAELVSFASTAEEVLIPVLMGSTVSNAGLISHSFEGAVINGSASKSQLVNTALYYLNAPYLWGGKTPFGIDCAGLTQMVYKINGFQLPRTAAQQAEQGEALSFIEESEAGDLAFFDNKEGTIDHVGIIMKDNYIIHAHGKVRIDRLDHTGIFNTEERRYTHSLRVIKKIA